MRPMSLSNIRPMLTTALVIHGNSRKKYSYTHRYHGYRQLYQSNCLFWRIGVALKIKTHTHTHSYTHTPHKQTNKTNKNVLSQSSRGHSFFISRPFVLKWQIHFFLYLWTSLSKIVKKHTRYVRISEKHNFKNRHAAISLCKFIPHANRTRST